MNKAIARLGAAGAVAALGVAIAAGPAGADTPEVFAASAAGQALKLTAFGQNVTAGISDVKGGSNLNVTAHAIGELTALATTAENTATAKGDNQSQATPENCGTPALNLPLPIKLDLACSSAKASVANGLPSASATGKVAGLSLDATSLNLPDIPVVSQVLNQVPLAQVENQLNNALGINVAQVLNVNAATTTLTQTLQGLGLGNILTANLGNSTSSLTSAADKVVSNATASGGEIDILGLANLNGKPLAQILVGSASATATYDRVSGKATPSFDPSLVTVILNQATGQIKEEVAPGQSVTILAGTPLESTITVADGSTVKNADGSVTATASAVALDLLKGIQGGIGLHLADATASIGGNPAVYTPVAQATPVKALPFTGSTPTLPLAGAGLLGVALVGRRVWRIFR
ncbi:MAG TPA: hypothetical protein VFA11_03940 [Acidimicrobiales bacterium]|nr:hypothetical protein [Acidimicrobiales bacterium]